MRRSVTETVRIESTEDILASLARMSAEAEQIERVNDYAQARIVDIRKRCADLQQQVIAVTGYEYGREKAAA